MKQQLRSPHSKKMVKTLTLFCICELDDTKGNQRKKQGKKQAPPVAWKFPTVGCRTKFFARVNFFIQSNKSNFQKVRYQRKEFIHVFRSQIWRVLFVRQIFKYKGHVGVIMIICTFRDFAAFCLIFSLKHAKDVGMFRFFLFFQRFKRKILVSFDNDRR